MASPTITVVRNEVESDFEYHCDALEGVVSDAAADTRAVDYPAGERPDLEETNGVVITGSTAGVYEVDARSWIADQKRLVRELVDREMPTLGVCFGHQIANAALGGTVEQADTTARPVDTDLADEPLFDGVASVVPVTHGDVVTEPGDEMDVIASADYYPAFATRHRTAPLWTVQFHPEFTAALRERLEADFGWAENEHGFADVNATRVVENFASIVDDATAAE
ncbi:glutamine amidotransferase class-I [Haloterrigena turkmenica DSM 5511]|uniref:Glutamine amidotransferase class-I n=1 Tax=Haloterrigena turkmenica (strain ATCC 51198 / DSM 5511 / JCM 9101 / NCIMB 13204 / VKM B-1734 / 4k) TaxID=543526 RepID=D2RR93_HALTV|nr:type 1 glutamine amidotransferase [Haloterrigena turkmenica]ADB62489.1 glutamine amidotransferase class-I [Haloterrigena turkmenica DSM 5511]